VLPDILDSKLLFFQAQTLKIVLINVYEIFDLKRLTSRTSKHENIQDLMFALSLALKTENRKKQTLERAGIQ
jgi:hypothetical protein